MSTTRKNIVLPETTIEKAEKLMERFEIISLTELIRRAISYMYEDTVGNYKEALAQRANKTPLTPVEKANAELDAQDARAQAKRDKMLQLCTDLEGTVDGNGFCVYPRYELSALKDGRVEIETINTPLMDLHPVDLTEKYRDKTGKAVDKKVVEKAIKLYGTKN